MRQIIFRALVFVPMLCLPVLAGNLPYYGPVWQNAQTDQERCEAEARYMAARGIRGHVGLKEWAGGTVRLRPPAHHDAGCV